VINRQFSAVRLRDQVRASRTTLESWRATKPTTMGNVQCNEPDAHSNFAGEPLSHIGASQEGAILSARRAINMIDKHRHTACVMVRCHL
jgi:monoamine oxidase